MGMVTMPADSAATTVERLTDRRDGGLLLVVRREASTAREAIDRLGLPIRMWSNGSLEPEGWAWELDR